MSYSDAIRRVRALIDAVAPSPSPAPATTTGKASAADEEAVIASLRMFVMSGDGACLLRPAEASTLLAMLDARPATPADEARDDFGSWLCREMPAGTVIGDPRWWAARIAARARAASAVPVVVREAVAAWVRLTREAAENDQNSRKERDGFAAEADALDAWLRASAGAEVAT